MAKRIALFTFIFLGLLGRASYALGQGESSLGQEPLDAALAAVPEEVTPGESAEVAAADDEDAALVSRDPFWPVGYVPRNPQPAVMAAAGEGASPEVQSALDLAGLTAEEQQVIKQRMRVGGVLQQAGAIWAILNNQLVSQGETVKIDTGRKVYIFLVKELTPDRIVLESQQDP